MDVQHLFHLSLSAQALEQLIHLAASLEDLALSNEQDIWIYIYIYICGAIPFTHHQKHIVNSLDIDRFIEFFNGSGNHVVRISINFFSG